MKGEGERGRTQRLGCARRGLGNARGLEGQRIGDPRDDATCALTLPRRHDPQPCLHLLTRPHFAPLSRSLQVKIWDLDEDPGKELFSFECFNTPARYVEYSCGDKMALLTTDPFMQSASAIHILKFTDDVKDQHTQAEPAATVEGKIDGRITRAVWGDCNETFYTCGEDGYLRIWDTEKMEIIKEQKAHGKNIGDLHWSKDKTHFITASVDKTAKLWDAKTLTCLKTYENSAPVNSAAISPIMEHIMLGGGQDASQVTTTSHKSGKFESKFYHKIFEEEFGRVPGHFGPINTMSFHPNGRSFTTGGEDGYVRIHHFDPDYFQTDSWFGMSKLRKMYEETKLAA